MSAILLRKFWAFSHKFPRRDSFVLQSNFSRFSVFEESTNPEFNLVGRTMGVLPANSSVDSDSASGSFKSEFLILFCF